MNLNSAKRVLLVCGCVMALLMLLCGMLRSPLLGYLSIAAAVAGAVVWLIFGRCPHCGRFLGRTYDKFCPHCGQKLP